MGISLEDCEGKQAAVEAIVDDGAMVAAMDTKVYENLRTKIGGWRTTHRKFRMANGTVVPGEANWAGRIGVNGVGVDGEFEVFDSGGSWKFLFGKPLLEQFSAVHDYRKESLVLHGKEGNWREVFNDGLGAVVPPQPKPKLEDRNQQDVPRPTAQAHAVLEESVEPAGGVTVKALTPLDREVVETPCTKPNLITNDSGQHQPKVKPSGRRFTPRIEDVPDEDLTRAHTEPYTSEGILEGGTDDDGEDWEVAEIELQEWLREMRQKRREDAAKQQEDLSLRQQERRNVWEKEEEQREVEWVAWLREQRAEPGLRRWFFWRNRFKTLSPPRRLRVEALGGVLTAFLQSYTPKQC
ncbi:MAG: hypothetical protein NXY57DRAFT_970056 [Lentinula lateritia]|nr:MAG: hypothetical protein NXY57DRAFT_970056 [Lentinula lateritia]